MHETGYHITQIQSELIPLAAGTGEVLDFPIAWMIMAVVVLLAAMGLLLYCVQQKQHREELQEEERILRGMENLEFREHIYKFNG